VYLAHLLKDALSQLIVLLGIIMGDHAKNAVINIPFNLDLVQLVLQLFAK